MTEELLPGLGMTLGEAKAGFTELSAGGDGLWTVGQDGVRHVLTPHDRKVEFVVFAGHTLAYVKSSMGYPAIYPVPEVSFEGPAEAVLMDLDGTSVSSEEFWIWVIEQTTSRLLRNPKFQLEEADLPHVSGHSVSEHLQYCIAKYCPEETVEQARTHYFDITHHELSEIVEGRGRPGAFKPTEGLKEFLQSVKAAGIRVGLVTSGLYEKAWPEIVSAFQAMGMGDPLEYYDAIISAGDAIRKGQAGTLGELAPKPHPWLYAETARVGLGIAPDRRHRVIGLEDSSAGVVSVRLAGFEVIGMQEGNIDASGTGPLLYRKCHTLHDALPLVLGGT